MNIMVVDGNSGLTGCQLIIAISLNVPDGAVFAVGLDQETRAAMLKAGARTALGDERAVVSGAKAADVIMGPEEITVAGSLGGQITKRMADAINKSKAVKILIPPDVKEEVDLEVPLTDVDIDTDADGIADTEVEAEEKIEIGSDEDLDMRGIVYPEKEDKILKAIVELKKIFS